MSTSRRAAALPLLVGLIFSACSNNPQEPATVTEMPAPPAAVADPVTALGTDDAVGIAESPSAEVRVNPPHGEPGHRCEIPVGAPLDEAPAQPAIQPEINIQSPVAPASAMPASGSARLNPPHGEPGHDCAVPVGSPLPG